MAPNDDTIFLKTSVDVLSFFNENEIRKITPDIERNVYRTGQTLLVRGEVTTGFYIIKKGKAIASYKTQAGGAQRELKAGDFFGEITLLEDMPSEAAIKAAEDETEVLTIPSDSFKKLLEMQPRLKTSLLNKVAQRRKAIEGNNPDCSVRTAEGGAVTENEKKEDVEVTRKLSKAEKAELARIRAEVAAKGKAKSPDSGNPA